MTLELEDKNRYIVAADSAVWRKRWICSAMGFRDSYTKMNRVSSSQHYLEYGYKELAILPGKNGEWVMEKNALHIWPGK